MDMCVRLYTNFVCAIVLLLYYTLRTDEERLDDESLVQFTQRNLGKDPGSFGHVGVGTGSEGVIPMERDRDILRYEWTARKTGFGKRQDNRRYFSQLSQLL